MHRLIKFFNIALILLIVSGVMAQKQQPPAGGPPEDFKLPQKSGLNLQNGLRATFVPYGTIPKVTIKLVIRTGNLNEAENQVWLADLTGDLMKEGTQTKSSEEIARAAAAMGGQVDISVGPDQTNIEGEVLTGFGDDLVHLIADIVQNPLFPESEIGRLKKDMLRTLSIQKSQPRPLALEKFRKVLYPGHPYGRVFPTEAMIESYTIDKIKAFFNTNFGAARSHIYLVGKFDDGKVKKAIQQAFGDWKTGPGPLKNPPNPVTDNKIYIIDRPGAPQSTLYIGLPVIDPSHDNYVALELTNALVGGFFSSRITTNIREDKGYTYSPYSQVSARFRDAYWLQIADVGTEVTAPALKEIFYEINRLNDESPPEDELKGVKNYLAGVFVLRNSSRTGIINQLSFLDLHGLDDSYLSNYVRNIHTVTPEKVRQIMREYLDPEKMTKVIVGNKKIIWEEVAVFGPIAD